MSFSLPPRSPSIRHAAKKVASAPPLFIALVAAISVAHMTYGVPAQRRDDLIRRKDTCSKDSAVLATWPR